jgi:hypothetical protein
MIASRSPALDRRGDPRVTTRVSILFKAPQSMLVREGKAILEELSGSGLRFRTRSHLHPEEALTLYLPHEAQPLHAEVLWVRASEAALATPPRTWTVGCRLLGDSIGKARIIPTARPGWSPGAAAARTVLRGAISMGAVALLVYLFLRFVSIIGSFTVH